VNLIWFLSLPQPQLYLPLIAIWKSDQCLTLNPNSPHERKGRCPLSKVSFWSSTIEATFAPRWGVDGYKYDKIPRKTPPPHFLRSRLLLHPGEGLTGIHSQLAYSHRDREKSRVACAPIVKLTEDLRFFKKYHWIGNFKLILKMVFKLKIKQKMTKLWVPKKG